MPAYIRLNDKENFLNKLSKKVINEEYPFKPELTLAIPNYRYLENTSKEKGNEPGGRKRGSYMNCHKQK